MKDIKGFEGLYSVTSCGRIWSHVKNIFLSPGIDMDGYYTVVLYKDGKKYTKRIHRLVAEAYLPNPDNLPQVNHIDENKEHNNVQNLEWCDCQYNIDYSQSKAVKCVETDEVYKSIRLASRKTGIPAPRICDCVNGKHHTCGGYHWIKF